jgi:hypothetical protein
MTRALTNIVVLSEFSVSRITARHQSCSTPAQSTCSAYRTTAPRRSDFAGGVDVLRRAVFLCERAVGCLEDLRYVALRQCIPSPPIQLAAAVLRMAPAPLFEEERDADRDALVPQRERPTWLHRTVIRSRIRPRREPNRSRQGQGQAALRSGSADTNRTAAGTLVNSSIRINAVREQSRETVDPRRNAEGRSANEPKSATQKHLSGWVHRCVPPQVGPASVVNLGHQSARALVALNATSVLSHPVGHTNVQLHAENPQVIDGRRPRFAGMSRWCGRLHALDRLGARRGLARGRVGARLGNEREAG